MKLCKQCNIVKSYSFFWKRSDSKDGYRYHCKDCTNNINKKSINPKSIEKSRLNSKKWRDNNIERSKANIKRWMQENPGACNARNAKRHAQKLNATPKWLSNEQIETIKSIYIDCPKGYHVDHIVPLQGKNVCGLHVPWNLNPIPAKENVSKKNKF